jgi:hypothetical protein
MGAESTLRFRLVPRLQVAAWISLVVLLAALALLVYAAVLGMINPGPSPASEPLLMGPFRWLSKETPAA